MPETLLIRADASPSIGTGHVMRCLALAQVWQQAGGKAVFAQAETTSAVEQRIRGEALEVVRLEADSGNSADVSQTTALARARGAAWVVADGYRFDADWQRQIMAAGCRLLLVDDYGHADHYSADWVLNQNLHAAEELYTRREPSTRLLLGTRYVLLRREFLSWAGRRREIPARVRNVLVTLGGSDPDNVTARVMQALYGMENLEVIVVVGGSNPNVEALTALGEKMGPTMRLVVGAGNMPELMAKADLAVAAGGTTSWELAFMGLPSVVMVLTDNQRAIARSVQEGGLGINLGEHAEVKTEQIAQAVGTLLTGVAEREMMSRRGQSLVDGLGSQRVSAALLGGKA